MNSLIGNIRRPDVSFYRGGRIDITARVAKLLELEDGDVIDIAENYAEYYLYVRHRKVGLSGSYESTCRRTKEKSNNFRAYSRRLVDAVLTVCKKDGNLPNVVRLPIGNVSKDAEGNTMIALITLNNIIKR